MLSNVDWVKLDINGSYRGEVYLEMTFFSSGAAPPKAPAPTPSAPSSYLQASVPLSRRPSKLSSSDRMTRPSQPYHYSVPASLSPHGPPSPSQNQDYFSTQYVPSRGSHLSPPRGRDQSPSSSSRSSSGSPGRHGRDAALPSVPEEGIQSGGGRGGGGGKVPTILRPGKPKSSPQPSSSLSSPTMPGSYPNDGSLASTVPYQPVTGQVYQPVTVSYQAPQPQPSPYPIESHPTISFPVPVTTPVYQPPVGSGYAPPTTYGYGRSPFPQQEELPDPFLSKRYHTPLPLPAGATFPSPSSNKSTPAHNPKSAEETEKALKLIAQRKAQEEEDLEFARKLDREMNLE
jgi:hypothetical protein